MFLQLSALAAVALTMTSAALPANYQTLPALEKQSIMWTKCSASPYPSLPLEGPSVFVMANAANPLYFKPTFMHDEDEMPDSHSKKIFHPLGATAKIEFKMSNLSTFTGLFKTGTVGIARISIGAMDDEKFIPGMGVKLFLDGRSSINFFTLYSLDGQGQNYNVFEMDFSNIIPNPSSLAIQMASKVLALALRLLPGGKDDRPESEQNMPLYEAAAFEANGRAVSFVRAPYQLIFRPNRELGWDGNTGEDFRKNLINTVPEGSKLYDVILKRTTSSPEENLGELISQSAFVASQYQDEVMFMKHPTKPWKA